MNVTLQLLVYADHDVRLLGESIQTAKKNTEGLLDDSKQTGLEANVERTTLESVFSKGLRMTYWVEICRPDMYTFVYKTNVVLMTDVEYLFVNVERTNTSSCLRNRMQDIITT